jgi:hypothetical protein
MISVQECLYGVLISTGSCMFIMEGLRMAYVFINRYLYAY